MPSLFGEDIIIYIFGIAMQVFFGCIVSSILKLILDRKSDIKGGGAGGGRGNVDGRRAYKMYGGFTHSHRERINLISMALFIYR